MPKSKWVRINEACGCADITRASVTCAIRRGALRQRKVGSRIVVNLDEVKDYAERHPRRDIKRQRKRMTADQYAALSEEATEAEAILPASPADSELRKAALDALCFLLVIHTGGNGAVKRDDIYQVAVRLKNSLLS